MPPAYLSRAVEQLLRRRAREFPALILTGPRQSGKTTVLRRVFGGTHRYVSLDVPDVRARATDDPRAFLAAHEGPIVLDEVQQAPALLSYVKERIDADRDRAGTFVLSGSQNLALSAAVTESLAGRAAMLTLPPLSRRESDGVPGAPLPWEDVRHGPPRPRARRELWPTLLRGGFPELARHPRREASAWHAAYVQTYLERDVRALRHVGDLTSFQAFVRALAARSAQLLDLSQLARDLGVAVNTVRAWLSVLEATYQVVVLRPYHANLTKRLVKTPKVYFTDTGTLAYLVGLRDARHAAEGPMGGALFETAVVVEVWKTLLARGETPRLHFWRTATGVEVDLLVEDGARLVPVEAKATATPLPKMAAGIASLRADLGASVADGWLVHAGDTSGPLGAGVRAVPWSAL